MKLSAVLFDVDGTFAETEDFHRKSFNESFKEFNLDWFWDEEIYRELIHVGGGKERIKYHINRAWPEMLNFKNLNKYIDSIHKVKNEIYGDFISESKIKPRTGVIRLVKELREKKVRMGLVSSSSEENVINLFETGLKIDISENFEIVAHGDCTPHKKPSPEVYEWALEKLKLPPQACIAIEDSPRGMESSLAAGISTIVTPSYLTIGENFDGAKLVISDLGEINKEMVTIKGNDHGHKIVDFELLDKLI